MRLLICEILEEDEEKGLGRLTDKSYEDTVLALLKESHERVKEDLYTPIVEVNNQAAVKAFFIRGAIELLDEKTTSLTSPEASYEGLSATPWSRQFLQCR